MPRRAALLLGAAGALLCVGGTLVGLLACLGVLRADPLERLQGGVLAGLLVILGTLLLAVRHGSRTWLGSVSLALRAGGVLYVLWGAAELALPGSQGLGGVTLFEGLWVYLGGEALRVLDQALRLLGRPPDPPASGSAG